MPIYLPADEISHKLFIASNLAAALYIACTDTSWLTGAAIVAAANIVPVIEAIATGTARRSLLGNGRGRYYDWDGVTSMQWSHRNNSATLFYYPTISPDCMSSETAEKIIGISKPFAN